MDKQFLEGGLDPTKEQFLVVNQRPARVPTRPSRCSPVIKAALKPCIRGEALAQFRMPSRGRTISSPDKDIQANFHSFFHFFRFTNSRIINCKFNNFSNIFSRTKNFRIVPLFETIVELELIGGHIQRSLIKLESKFFESSRIDSSIHRRFTCQTNSNEPRTNSSVEFFFLSLIPGHRIGHRWKSPRSRITKYLVSEPSDEACWGRV